MKQPIEVHVHIVQHLRPGGIEALSLEFCQQPNTNTSVFVISLEGQAKSSLQQWPRLAAFSAQIHFLDKQPGWSVVLVWQLRRLLKQLGATVVFTHHIGPMLYGGLAARLAGVSNLIHVEHDAWHLAQVQHQRIAKFCIATCRPILVADAHRVAESLQRYLPAQRFEVIENGVNTKRFDLGSQHIARRELKLPLKTMLIGCAARLHPVKGHKTLLAALRLLPQGVHLALAGTGETESELRKLAQQLGVAARVHFLGHVDDMPMFYQALDVFCLASDHEGMPLSPLEAQACGKTVVLTNVGGCAQCISPQSGLLVPPRQPDQLASALHQMLSQSATTAPRTFVVQQRSVEVMLQRYQQLLSNRTLSLQIEEN